MKKQRDRKWSKLSLRGFIKASAAVLLAALVFDGTSLLGSCSQEPPASLSKSGMKGLDARAAVALKVLPAYMPLPPGAVRPTGWLLDWAKAARDGLTGHLDERANAFGMGWSGKHFEAKGVREQGTGEPIEPCAYWLDGLVRLGYALQDEYLINKARSRLDVVVNGVLDGGPSLIWWRPKEELDIPFENWAHSHMGRALVAYYQATGNPRILEALVRAYRDYPLPDMQHSFPIRGLNGPVNIDPMLEVFAMSGEPQILKTVLAMIRRPAFVETVDRWLQECLEPGHAVIFHEYVRLPALVYPWTGDHRHLNATLRALNWSDRNYLLPYGICSGEEYHAGIGSTRNTETCNIPASMWTYLWLLRITGRQEHGDNIEQIFFNAGPAPIARDFQTICYYQSPNRLSTSLPHDEPRDPSLPGSYLFTETGHSTLCCTGNFNRVLPFYITHMWMTTPDRGLAATLYGPCQVETKLADGIRVSIQCQTHYPFDEKVHMTISPQKSANFPLYLRIPGWCREPVLQIDGRSVALQRNPQGFAVIERLWKPGDTIVLQLPMTTRVVQGRETPFPRISRYTETEPGQTNRELAGLTDISNPFASVYCGPILFALGIGDENPNKVAAGAKWKYAVDVAPIEAQQRVEVIRRPMPDRWQWQLDAPFQLKVPVLGFDWNPTELQPLPSSPVEKGRNETITLVPYGCTKFRVSMFPVTKRSWRLGDAKAQ